MSNNRVRKAMLRKLFLKEDELPRRRKTVQQARDALARDYWKEEGCLIRPHTCVLRREVFREESK